MYTDPFKHPFFPKRPQAATRLALLAWRKQARICVGPKHSLWQASELAALLAAVLSNGLSVSLRLHNVELRQKVHAQLQFLKFETLIGTQKAHAPAQYAVPNNLLRLMQACQLLRQQQSELLNWGPLPYLPSAAPISPLPPALEPSEKQALEEVATLWQQLPDYKTQVLHALSTHFWAKPSLALGMEEGLKQGIEALRDAHAAIFSLLYEYERKLEGQRVEAVEELTSCLDQALEFLAQQKGRKALHWYAQPSPAHWQIADSKPSLDAWLLPNLAFLLHRARELGLPTELLPKLSDCLSVTELQTQLQAWQHALLAYFSDLDLHLHDKLKRLSFLNDLPETGLSLKAQNLHRRLLTLLETFNRLHIFKANLAFSDPNFSDQAKQLETWMQTLIACLEAQKNWAHFHALTYAILNLNKASLTHFQQAETAAQLSLQLHNHEAWQVLSKAPSAAIYQQLHRRLQMEELALADALQAHCLHFWQGQTPVHFENLEGQVLISDEVELWDFEGPILHLQNEEKAGQLAYKPMLEPQISAQVQAHFSGKGLELKRDETKANAAFFVQGKPLFLGGFFAAFTAQAADWEEAHFSEAWFNGLDFL